MKTVSKTRFDARISVEQKEFFERAATIGGYRSFTDFVIWALQEKAKEIIEERKRFLASEEDCKIFFDALMNPPEPNDALKSAAEDYKKFLKENAISNRSSESEA